MIYRWVAPAYFLFVLMYRAFTYEFGAKIFTMLTYWCFISLTLNCLLQAIVVTKHYVRNKKDSGRPKYQVAGADKKMPKDRQLSCLTYSAYYNTRSAMRWGEGTPIWIWVLCSLPRPYPHMISVPPPLHNSQGDGGGIIMFKIVYIIWIQQINRYPKFCARLMQGP